MKTDMIFRIGAALVGVLAAVAVVYVLRQPIVDTASHKTGASMTASVDVDALLKDPQNRVLVEAVREEKAEAPTILIPTPPTRILWSESPTGVSVPVLIRDGSLAPFPQVTRMVQNADGWNDVRIERDYLESTFRYQQDSTGCYRYTFPDTPKAIWRACVGQ